MENININGYLQEEFSLSLKEALNKKSIEIPYLYNGDLWQIEKTIEALEYLFNKSFEANLDEETRTRLSQMGGIYLNPIIVELKDYKDKLEKLQNTINASSINKNNKPIYYGRWYEEYKGD